MQGTIVKGIGGFYYVKVGTTVFTCKARGIFKKEGLIPMVGDEVKIQTIEGEEGVINEILPRKNEFIRPPISNVDRMVVVIAAAHPSPNLTLTDRFLVTAEKSNARIILCINKTDIAKGGILEEISQIYSSIYPLYPVSAVTGEGLSALEQYMEKGRTAFVGPSGVGKSTILNALNPGIGAETGDVSRKTRRGKHTTRHVEIFSMKAGGMVYDTPGFTSFDILDATEEELHHFFPEMEPYIGRCRYDNCRHIREPGCAVVAAVDGGEIHQSRYDSYRIQIEEIRNRKEYE
ncbi:MAG: ribosome small subunit-dependent GTPase A [Anaerovoracaceae bacterium]|jgi:ribosome biogenesis GTPase